MSIHRYRVYVKKDVDPDKETYVILTDVCMFFARTMKECAELLRAEQDYSSIFYAGELLPLHRVHLKEVMKRTPLSNY